MSRSVYTKTSPRMHTIEQAREYWKKELEKKGKETKNLKVRVIVSRTGTIVASEALPDSKEDDIQYEIWKIYHAGFKRGLLS